MISGLPVKTKIVAWGMVIIGIVCAISILIYLIVNIYFRTIECYSCYKSQPIAIFFGILLAPGFYLLPSLYGLPPDIEAVVTLSSVFLLESFLILFLHIIFLSILVIFFGFFILKRKRWAWWGAIIFLVVQVWLMTHQLLNFVALNIFTYFNPSLYISGIFLILLLFDRKKYFESCS